MPLTSKVSIGSNDTYLAAYLPSYINGRVKEGMEIEEPLQS